MDLKRVYVFKEETFREGGQALATPLKRVAAAAVIQNPFAGRFRS